jgi:hypothetical protein
LSSVVVQLSWVTIALGVIAWFVIEDILRDESESSADHAIAWQDVLSVLKMPVFSLGTLLDYAYSVVVHRDYYGHV